MPSIDERVVAMSFENQVFETRVAQTMATLGKLDTAIKNIGSVNGLQNIEAAANKVTLQAPMSALDKLKAKLGSAGSGAAQGFSDIDKAGNKVTLEGPSRAIDKLQGKMGQLSAGTTFTDIEKASDRVELSGLTRALDSVTNKFSVLQGAASVALGNITAQAALKGGQFAKSFAFGPIQDGMKEYQTNLQSIQTILANTQGQQVSGLGEVNKHLNELNTYSDKTIYNFSEMAKNIGTFTAAGVDLDTSTKSIKGIANLAALSGSNSQQASTAMYQLSQAISSGRVGLQDWNSVVNAGMGGAVFQKALERTGENMGTIAKGALKVDKATGKATVNGESFRNSIMAAPGKESWLTSDVLTKTLTQFTGDLSDAQLKAQGFNAEQIKTIQQTAKSAQDAATQVKTLPQVFDVARETIGSGWAKTFQLIFGDFNQSKKTFTELSNTINGFINRTSKARNALLTAFDGLGGRDKLINSIKTAFSALSAAIRPVYRAFRNIFPPTTAKDLISFVDGFQHLAEAVRGFFLQHGGELQNTFQGFFAVLDIGWTIVKRVAGVLFDLLGVIGKGSGGFLSFTASIGRFLTSVDDALVKGGALTGFFKGISGVLAVPVKLLQTLASAFFGLFDGFNQSDAAGLETNLDGVNKSLGPMKAVVDAVAKAWGHFVDILGELKQAFQPLFDNITNAVSGFADTVVSAFQNQNYDAVMSTIQTTLVGGIFLTLKKALSSGLGLDVGGGVLKNVNESLHVLTGNLQAMQRGVQAGTLAAIAASIVLLAGGVLLLSKIDPKALTRAMTAVAVGLGELVGALALLSKFATGTFSLPFVAASMIALAAAVTILAVAVTIFSKLSWEDLAKGLLGVAGALTAVGVGTKFIGPGIIVSAGGVLIMAVALNVLAVAVKQFATLDWESLAKGLIGVAGSLLAISLGLVGIGPEVLLIGPGLVLVALALSTLAAAVGMFGKMDPKAMFQGLFGIAGALVAIGLSVATIPPTVGLQAAGLVILAAALTGIAGVIKVLGNMDVSTLVKGIIAMGGALLVLGVGLIFMEGTLGGSVALLAAAAAFAILGPTLGFLGSLKWGTIFKGLATIALVLATLAVVGALAATPLAALGAALVVLGIGFLAVTAPIYILAKALQLLGDEGTKGIAVMVAALTGFIAILPTIVINFIKGLVQIIAEVAKIAPQVLTAISSMLDTILAFVIEAAPKLAVAVGVLVSAFLKVLVDNAPKLIDAGFQLLEGLVAGIASNIGHLTAQAANIIVRFLTELQGHAPSITAAGVGTMTAFLLGISNKIPNLVAAVVNLVTKFIGAVVSKLPSIFTSAVTMMLKFIGGIVSKIPAVISTGASILFKLIEGIGKTIPRLISTAVSVASRFVRTMAHELVSLVDVGFHAMIDFMNGLARTIRTNTQPMIDAGFNLASAIIDGMVKGFTQLGQRAIDAVGHIISSLPKKALKLLDAHSPSKVFVEIGGFVVQGLAQGLADPSGSTARVMEATTQGIIDTAKSNLSRIPAALDGLVDMDPVITPVLDLTQITRDAAKLNDMTNVVPITAAASLGQASAISGETQAAADAQAAHGGQAGPTFNYEQNLYSPEALSDVEIYRQTKNQLSQVKAALGVAS